jgi:2,3-bisphosphoglycerate-independent phosphoglycerate mutase
MKKGPFLFVILDGFGVREEREGNAIAQSRTPFFNYISGKSSDENLARRFGPVSYTTLTAVGPAVGMPEGAKGSTAVGHEVLSGVDYKHPMYLIEEGIKNGEMVSPVIDSAINYAREHRSALHLMGLISDNREHSDIRHLYAILKRAARLGQKKIWLHFFSDGRGSPPQSGPRFVKELRAKILEITEGDGGQTPPGARVRGQSPSTSWQPRTGTGVRPFPESRQVGTPPQRLTPSAALRPPGRAFDIRIATVGGRDLTMNRSALYWNKTVGVFRAIVEAEAPRVDSIDSAFRAAYALGLNDQYVPVSVIGEYGGVENYDSLIHFNFRRDRTEFLMKLFAEPEEKIAEILRKSGDPTCEGIARFKKAARKNLQYATVRVTALVEYYKGIPCPVAFRAQAHEYSLGRFLSERGFRQKFISGVDKAGALLLLNGAEKKGLHEGQESIVVPLPPAMGQYIRDYDVYKGRSGFEKNPYAKYPKVELAELTQTVVREVGKGDGKTFIAVNICNPDMVGHTADMEACVEAVEAIDVSLRGMAEALLAKDGVMVMTADHGNIEELQTGGEPNTYHTRARVPFAVLGLPKRELRDGGTLKDVAPTILCILFDGQDEKVRKHLPGRPLGEEP